MENYSLCSVQDFVESCLSNGKLIRFHVFSRSMFPSIRPQDLICVRKANIDEINLGAVVVIRRGNSWVVHRIVRVFQENNSKSILTKGDNNSFADSVNDDLSRIGIVIGLYRKDNWINYTCLWSNVGALFLVILSNIQLVVNEFHSRIFHYFIGRCLSLLIFIIAKIFYNFG